MIANSIRQISLNRDENSGRPKNGRPTQARATGKLYHTRAIVGATVLGSPIAGAILMAHNYRRLGRPGAAAAVLLGGFALVAVLLLMTSGTTSFELIRDTSMVGVATMALAARLLQWKYVKEHVKAGGSLASGWDALGIAALCLVVIVSVDLMVAGN